MIPADVCSPVPDARAAATARLGVLSRKPSSSRGRPACGVAPPGPGAGDKVRHGAEARLREVAARGPRTFGHATSLWTLLPAEVGFAQGLTRERVSDEMIRRALRRLGVRWRRARPWPTTPDPAYRRRQGRVIG